MPAVFVHGVPDTDRVWHRVIPLLGRGRRLAERTGARLVTFPGCSHWWPLERPTETAAELRSFWGRAA